MRIVDVIWNPWTLYLKSAPTGADVEDLLRSSVGFRRDADMSITRTDETDPVRVQLIDSRDKTPTVEVEIRSTVDEGREYLAGRLKDLVRSGGDIQLLEDVDWVRATVDIGHVYTKRHEANWGDGLWQGFAWGGLAASLLEQFDGIIEDAHGGDWWYFRSTGWILAR